MYIELLGWYGYGRECDAGQESGKWKMEVKLMNARRLKQEVGRVCR